MDTEEAYQECERITWTQARNFAYGIRLLPPPKRRALAAVYAFAVLYLPYSLIGPFAGVFLDRWSRQQILVWSAPIRGALVVVTAGLMVADIRSVPPM